MYLNTMLSVFSSRAVLSYDTGMRQPLHEVVSCEIPSSLRPSSPVLTATIRSVHVERVIDCAKPFAPNTPNWKCVDPFPSSLTTNVCRDTLPSVVSRVIKSLAFACSPDAAPRLTVLSNYERRGLAPNSSHESGRGLLCEFDPPLGNRPCGINDEELAPLEANPEPDPDTDEVEPAPRLRSSGSICSDWDCDGALNVQGDGALQYSLDTARVNGTGTTESLSPH